MHLRRVASLIGIAITILACSSRATDSVVGCPMALIEGVLVVHDQETAIQAGDTLSRITWPRGYALWSSGGPITVLDDGGHVVATTGEFVQLVGGYISGDDHWTTCGPPLERR